MRIGKRTMQFSTNIFVMVIENSIEICQEMAFFAPRDQYINCLLAGLAQPFSMNLLSKDFYETYIFRLQLVPFNCYQLSFRFSQAFTIKVCSSFDFIRFPDFGQTHKLLFQLEVGKATFQCDFVKEKYFLESLFVWGIVTLTIICFSNMLLESSTLIHELASLVFQFKIFISLGFELFQTAV